MSGTCKDDKLTLRALDYLDYSSLFTGTLEFPEGTTGLRVYGTGLPREGVYVSKEQADGVTSVATEFLGGW